MHRVVVTADLVCENEIGIESARNPAARHDVNAQYATVASNYVARRMGMIMTFSFVVTTNFMQSPQVNDG
jgi:hypothetical protein